MTRISLGLPASSHSRVQRLSEMTLGASFVPQREFTDPSLVSQRCLQRLLINRGIVSKNEGRNALSDRFVRAVPVDFFGPSIPGYHLPVEILYGDGIRSQIDELRLFAQAIVRLPKMVRLFLDHTLKVGGHVLEEFPETPLLRQCVGKLQRLHRVERFF